MPQIQIFKTLSSANYITYFPYLWYYFFHTFIQYRYIQIHEYNPFLLFEEYNLLLPCSAIFCEKNFFNIIPGKLCTMYIHSDSLKGLHLIFKTFIPNLQVNLCASSCQNWNIKPVQVPAKTEILNLKFLPKLKY